MKLYKKILVSLLLPLMLMFSQPVIAEPIEIVNPINLSPQEQVIYFSNLYGGDSKIINKVIECESNWKHETIGDRGLSRGILQFQKSTFNRMAKDFGEELDYNSQYDQIKLGTWALSNPKYQREWTAYRTIMNGGTYSFYSNQLKRHFTVTCK